MAYRPNRPTTAAKEAAMNFIRPDPLELEVEAESAARAQQPAQNVYPDPALFDGDLAAHKALEAKANSKSKYTPAPAVDHAPVADHHAPMAGELVGTERISRFITGGHAIFTVKSKRTGARFTFQFSRPDDEPGKPRPIWARVLTGPDNTSDYTFAGTFWPAGEGFEYRRSAKVSLTDSAPSLVALRWFMANLGNEARMEQMEIHHEGRCCRCGRRLTVPSSIESGIGPDCAQKM